MADPRFLADYLLSKLDEGEGDVKLVMGEGDAKETMMAHGFVLRRAAYFESALKDSFLEGQTRCVELPDTPPALMKPLIQSLYSDKFSHTKQQDSIKKLSTMELFELCLLCERFLVPEEVTNCAYETFSKSLGADPVTGKQFIDIIDKLDGKDVPKCASDAVFEGFSKCVDTSDCLPLVFYAIPKKVSNVALMTLNNALVRKVAWGQNLVHTAARAAEGGAFQAAEAILQKASTVAFSDAYIRDCDRERAGLLKEAATLPQHLLTALKLSFATKVMTCPRNSLAAAFNGHKAAAFQRESIIQLGGVREDDSCVWAHAVRTFIAAREEEDRKRSALVSKLCSDIQQIANQIWTDGAPFADSKRRKRGSDAWQS